MVRETGDLGRTVDVERLVVPAEIHLAGQHLRWQSGKFHEYRKVPAGLLDRFVRLAEAADGAILDLARQSGALWICKAHGLPMTHDAGCRPSYGGGWFREPLAEWRAFSARARAVLSIAASLHQGKLGDPNDWKHLGEGWLPDAFAPAKGLGEAAKIGRRRVESERAGVTNAVSGWLALARVTPALSWRENDVRLVFSEADTSSHLRLFGVLGMQLLFAVSRGNGPSVCSACGVPYVRSRRAAAGRRNYCKDCGTRAAWRFAKAKERTKP